VKLAIDGLAPGLQVRVVPRSERLPEGARAAACTEDCELELPKGTYTLVASRGDDHRTEEIELTSPQLLRVGQWDGKIRTTGIAMGLPGSSRGRLEPSSPSYRWQLHHRVRKTKT
jgi:hypothetical protein